MEIKPFIMENIDSSIMPISFLNRKIWTFVKIFIIESKLKWNY